MPLSSPVFSTRRTTIAWRTARIVFRWPTMILIVGSFALAQAWSAAPQDDQRHPSAFPLDIADAQWKTPLGKGAMLLPKSGSSAVRASQSGLTAFTRLDGVMLSPESGEIIFFGRRETGGEELDPRDLLDGLVLAWRATGGSAPGVSIDPRPEQLGGLKDGDKMNVVYFGGVEGTDFGLTAYRADVLMKFLSFGRDNRELGPKVSRRFQATLSKLKGHKTKLDLVAASPFEGNWHRYWIEQKTSEVTISPDRHTIKADVTLHVQTQSMAPAGGRLEPAGVPAGESAEKFAKQLTTGYDRYAVAFPAFAKLRAYAQLVSIAHAMRDLADDDPQYERKVIALLHGHQASPTKTPKTSAAMIDTVSIPGGLIQLQGGVNLEPARSALRADAALGEIAKEILANRRQDAWPTRSDQGVVLAAAASVTRPAEMYQEDLRLGRLLVARHYAPGTDGMFGRDWDLRRPRLSVSAERARFEDTPGELPRSVTFDDGRRRVSLTEFGKVTLPGQPPANAYTAKDGRMRLVCYRNAFYLLEGDVRFTADGESYRVSPGGRFVKFEVLDPRDPMASRHRVTSISDSTGTENFRYRENRLESIDDSKGAEIRFRYDNDRVAAASASGGRRVNYFYGEQDVLHIVRDEQGRRLRYLLDDAGAPRGLQAEISGARLTRNGAHEFEFIPDPEEFPKDPQTLYVTVEPEIEGSEVKGSMFRIHNKGRTILDNKLSFLHPRSPEAQQAIERLVHIAEATRSTKVVFVGERQEIPLKMRAMFSNKAPTIRFYSAADAYLASQNLHGDSPANGKVQILIRRDGLVTTDELKTALAAAEESGVQVQEVSLGAEGLPTPSDAGTVVFIAHCDTQTRELIDALGKNGCFRGKDLIQFMCDRESPIKTNMPTLKEYGAKSVTGFTAPIEQRSIPGLTENLIEALQRERETKQREERSLGRMIEEILKELEKIKPPVEKLNTYEQLGHRFKFQRAATIVDAAARRPAERFVSDVQIAA